MVEHTCAVAPWPEAVRFAEEELRRAGVDQPVRFCPDLASADATAGQLALQPLRDRTAQCFGLRRHGPGWVVLAADAAGALYGGLHLADAWCEGAAADLIPGDHRPHIERRGIKFNLPLDLRTPSYSDAGDPARESVAAVWDLAFWHTFLDEMARSRFNVLSLWNLHPFPSMVRVPEFPEAALDDVLVGGHPHDLVRSLRGEDMYQAAAMLPQATVLRRLGIDDKIRFWRAVMAHARDRGIAVYVITWNIYVHGVAGVHGIRGGPDDSTTRAYFRASVRELVLTYPLLAGIGVTAGEQMDTCADLAAREEWLWATYGEGVRDALAQQPGRQVRLIHRAHETSFAAIVSAFREFPGPVDLSFKYAIAHMYSHPAPPFVAEALNQLPAGTRLWMTVRNDDHYYFRWGDPAFARAFIRNLPSQSVCAGFYLGPDGHTWGPDTLSRQPDPARPLEIQRQWYTFRIWGLLAYDPDHPQARFQALLTSHLAPGETAAGARLFRAAAAAGRIVPAINRLHWNPLDFQWYPEACTSHPRHARGFHRVDHILRGEAMPGGGVCSIAALIAGESTAAGLPGLSPEAVIADLREQAACIDQELAGEDAHGESERARAVDDWRALAHLGRYYAAKCAAALELGRAERDHDAQRRVAAVALLREALDHWRTYATVFDRRYRPRFFTRLGMVDIPALTAAVADDIDLAAAWPIASVPPSGDPS